jgi:hypothetical protein
VDHHLGEFGGKLGRFRNHPDAGFRPIRAGHHTADIVVVDANRYVGILLPVQPDRMSGEKHTGCHDAQVQQSSHHHVALLSLVRPVTAIRAGNSNRKKVGAAIDL